MDKRRLRDNSLHDCHDVSGRVIHGLLCLLDGNGVAMSVLILEVVWRTKDDETAIDHDCNLVAQLLSFVHAMSC